MESRLQSKESLNNGNGGIGGVNVNGYVNGVLYVKVMTDEQLEILRTQIAVYALISEQLVEMHKSVTAQQDLAGVRLGNLYCDPLVTAVGHKITSRQRWTPTAVQLQILERIFGQGTGTPSKQKIKEITAELSQHGQISETNVYNWFQNRRARSKRKQLNNCNNNGESEAETDAESPKDKKITRAENFQAQHNSASMAEDLCFQSQEMSSGMLSVDAQPGKMEPVFVSDGSSKPSHSLSQLAFYESILHNPNAGIEQLMGKMEIPGNYNGYQSTEDYSMTG